MFLSVVSSTSNLASSATRNNSPLATVLHPCSLDGLDGVSFQRAADLYWGSLIEQDTHLPGRCRSLQAASGELQDGFDVLPRESVIRLYQFIDGHALFQTREDGGNRHSRAAKHPCPAHLSGYALYSRTLRPVKRCHRESPL